MQLLLCPHDYSFGLLQHSPYGTIIWRLYWVQNSATCLLASTGCCKDIILYLLLVLHCMLVGFGCNSKFWCHKEVSFVCDMFPSNYGILTLYHKQMHIQLISFLLFLTPPWPSFKALHISSNTFTLLLPKLPLKLPIRNKGNNIQFFLLFSMPQGI